MTKTVGLKDVLLPQNRSVNEEIFKIISLKNRVLQIEVSSSEDIQSIARKVSRCFGDCSIFTDLKAVRFQFNDVRIYVHCENSAPQAIVQKYVEKLKEKRQKEEENKKKEEEKRKKEEEHKAYLHKKELHKEYRRKQRKKMIDEASETEELLFINQKLKESWLAITQEAKNNNDTWLEKAIYFAERYAKYIQFLHKRHPDTNIKNFSENAVLDCSESEISTSLANQSLSLLRHYWNYNDIFYVPCSL